MRLAAAAIGVALTGSSLLAQEPALDAVLARAGVDVREFQHQLSGVVAEEHYVQDVRYPLGTGTRYNPLLTRHRELTSDLLLVKPVGADRWIHVLASELVAEDPTIRGTIDVDYAVEPAIGLRVPVSMRERYDIRRDGSRVDGEASYARYRQFQVRVDETLAPIVKE